MAALRLHKHDEQKITFKREPFGCVNRVPLFVAIGLIALGGFFGVQLLPREGEVAYHATSQLAIPGAIIGVGLLFFIAGAFLLPARFRNVPSEIVFDHRRAAVIVKMENVDHEGIIPYHDIDSFYVYRERSSPDSDTLETYSYHVVMKKKDGGEWFITHTVNPSTAQSDLKLLENQVPLEKPFNEVTTPVVSPKISLTEGTDQSLIAWKNGFTAAFFFLMLLTIMFGVAAFNVLQSSILPGLLFTAIVGVMVFILIRMFYKHTRQYAVSITSEVIEYFEFSTFTGQRSRLYSVPLESIERVVYTFSATVKSANRLWLMTREDIERQAVLIGSPRKIPDDLFERNQPLTLDVLALNPIECLQLEMWLQHKIRGSKSHSTLI